MVNEHRTVSVAHQDSPTPSFSRCRPAPAEQFHQISIDEFTLSVDVARFGFRAMTIGMAGIVSGCRPRFKWSAKPFSRNANLFHGLYLKPGRDYLDSKSRHFVGVA
jgi:hypothetical protein